ncbi:MAG TPA: hypothetical protein PKK94_29190 [Leptospiraceae bacterium]|nr:hypothetical protein [Leptospiraceae bacterium]
MEWILFFQKPPGGRIKYITSEMEDPSSMEYEKFLTFLLKNFKCKDYSKLSHGIDSFQTIIALRDGSWEIQPEEPLDSSDQSLARLLEFNENKAVQKNSARKDGQEEDDLLTSLEKRLSNFKMPTGKVFKWNNPFLKKRPINWKFWDQA